jgi:hypothetical protein
VVSISTTYAVAAAFLGTPVSERKPPGAVISIAEPVSPSGAILFSVTIIGC